jgi:DNA-binding beta-propeller fold protein YncE
MQTRLTALIATVALTGLLAGCPVRTPTDAGDTVAALAVALAPETQEAAIIDLRLNRVATTLKVGGVPSGLGATPGARLILVANDTTHTVRTFQQRDYALYNNLGDIGVGRSPQQIVVSDTTKEALVAVAGDRRVVVLDVSSVRDRPGLKGMATLTEAPVGVAVSSDGATMATATATQVLQITKGADGAYGTRSLTLPEATDRRLVAVALWHDRAVATDAQRSELLIVGTDGTTQTVDLKRDGRAAQPGRVVVNPQATKAYVACPGTNSIAIVDLAAAKLVQHVDLGSQAGNPVGLALLPDGTRLYVSTQVGRQLVIIETTPELVGPAATVSKAIGLSPSAAFQVPLSDLLIVGS